ncbi:hypothetical protein [Arsenophonus sp.]|uniref:hypothetical protein n=1 Tax=Arsenophonus sp. TaxID=1872640 RepID=UPI0028651B46|nr:hypothetical protein [Arsenophonus sp.]MDR5615229.1 hypothetical protein [Arsenophonus sp.]
MKGALKISFFKKILLYYHYVIDVIKSKNIIVVIDDIEIHNKKIFVLYHIESAVFVTNKDELTDFYHKYYDNLLISDRRTIIKYLAYNSLLKSFISQQEMISIDDIISYIERDKNEEFR